MLLGLATPIWSQPNQCAGIKNFTNGCFDLNGDGLCRGDADLLLAADNTFTRFYPTNEKVWGKWHRTKDTIQLSIETTGCIQQSPTKKICFGSCQGDAILVQWQLLFKDKQWFLSDGETLPVTCLK